MKTIRMQSRVGGFVSLSVIVILLQIACLGGQARCGDPGDTGFPRPRHARRGS